MDIAVYTIVLLSFLKWLLWLTWLQGMQSQATASQLLMIARAKVTLLNTKANLDQDHNHNQGPILVTLKAQGTIMVTTFIIMITGGGNSHTHPLPSLAWDRTSPPGFYINPWLLNWKPQHLFIRMTNLFPRTLSLTRSNGHRLYIILFPCLHQMLILVRFWTPATVLTAKTVSHTTWPQYNSDEDSYSSCWPKDKNFLQEAPNNLIGKKIPLENQLWLKSHAILGNAQNPRRPPGRI